MTRFLYILRIDVCSRSRMVDNQWNKLAGTVQCGGLGVSADLGVEDAGFGLS